MPTHVRNTESTNSLTRRVTVICGWPVSGKGAVARIISSETGWHWIDIDQVRLLNFGMPQPHPDLSEPALALDVAQMTGSYELLFSSVRINVGLGVPIIVTATFSRPSYWEQLFKVVPNDVLLKAIWCRPRHDDAAEIRRRLDARIFGVNCFSSVNSLERYDEVKRRFVAPPLPCLELDTSPPNTVEQCASHALAYLQASE